MQLEQLLVFFVVFAVLFLQLLLGLFKQKKSRTAEQGQPQFSTRDEDVEEPEARYEPLFRTPSEPSSLPSRPSPTVPPRHRQTPSGPTFIEATSVEMHGIDRTRSPVTDVRSGAGSRRPMRTTAQVPSAGSTDTRMDARRLAFPMLQSRELKRAIALMAILGAPKSLEPSDPSAPPSL